MAVSGQAILTLNISGLQQKTKHIKQLLKDTYCDFIFLQETNIKDTYTEEQTLFSLVLQKGMFSHIQTQHSGTAIIQTSCRWTITNTKIELDGRMTCMEIKNDTHTYTLVNIYAPATTQTRPVFYENLEIQLLKYNKETLILGGDFNITLEENDITGRRGINRAGRRELQHIINNLHLKDTFRALHPDTVEITYTNTDNKRAARLDRFYVATAINLGLAKHLSHTLNFTDHKATHIIIGNSVPPTNRGSTYWKFNDSLLDIEDFVKPVKTLLQDNLHLLETTNIISAYKILKDHIKMLAQKIGTEQKHKIKHEIEFIEKLLN